MSDNKEIIPDAKVSSNDEQNAKEIVEVGTVIEDKVQSITSEESEDEASVEKIDYADFASDTEESTIDSNESIIANYGSADENADGGDFFSADGHLSSPKGIEKASANDGASCDDTLLLEDQTKLGIDYENADGTANSITIVFDKICVEPVVADSVENPIGSTSFKAEQNEAEPNSIGKNVTKCD
ncbi:uncharacterized protein LOC119661954 [Teleopsis dalmanni]|uniref:uncharacterized protein LOC119661954 n=1 Tax=Teleopsis dalmanni TaxID=139649 RepID=UPI0018CD22A0|nr:uncharacterized protein LOC119661954 [Teleopsis dalmanni]